MKKIILTSFAICLFLTASNAAFAVNDVTIADLTNFDLNTADTAAAATITANGGGLVTNLDFQTNYIDITIDNLSTITLNTTVAGNYLKVTKQSGLDADFTLAPACPTTTATITGSGAQVVLRIQVYTTDQCGVTPPAGGSTGGGGYRPGSNISEGNITQPLSSPFTDISGHWAEFVINAVYQLGYVQGYEDNTFRPDQYITRAEAAKIIALWFDKNITDEYCNPDLYTDVSCTEWYGKYVGYLSDKGVLQGYGEGVFGPGRNVTRAEALKMMLYAKALQNTDFSDITNPFSDVFEEDWFYDEVLIGYKLAIVQGYEDGTFKPGNSVTRAEFAKIFNETFL